MFWFWVFLVTSAVCDSFVILFALLHVSLWRDTKYFFKKGFSWAGLSVACLLLSVGLLAIVYCTANPTAEMPRNIAMAVVVSAILGAVWFFVVFCLLTLDYTVTDKLGDNKQLYGWVKNGPGQPWKVFEGARSKIGEDTFGLNVFCSGHELMTVKGTGSSGWWMSAKVTVTPGTKSTPTSFHKLLEYRQVEKNLSDQFDRHLTEVDGIFKSTGDFTQARITPFTFEMPLEWDGELDLKFENFDISKMSRDAPIEVDRVFVSEA